MYDIQTSLKKLSDKKDLLEYLKYYMTDERTERFQEVLKNRTRHFTVVVEDLHKERNASAVVRTCDCFGIQDVYVIENHNEYQLSEGISMGAEKWVNVNIYDSFPDNTGQCYADLKNQGYQIIATSPHRNENQLDDFDISKKTAFIFGGEKEGLSDKAMKNADGFVNIPMFGFTGSFNISVAGALLLYNVMSKLHQSNLEWHLEASEMIDLQLDWTIKTIASSEQLITKYLEK
jgi:tRNA (guanosine-2'-O-)-methyltransferase